MKYSIAELRSIFIIAQTLFIIGSFAAFSALNLDTSILFLYILTIWNIVSYFWLFCLELTRGKSFNIIIVFILACLQYGGFSVLPLIDFLSLKIPVYLNGNEVNTMVTQANLFLMLEHLLIFVGYYAIANKKVNRISDGTIQNNSFDVNHYIRFAIRNYILIWILRIINILFPLGSISSVILSYSEEGYLITLAMLSYTFLNKSVPSAARKIFWLIVIIEVMFVLDSGMKQKIITVFIPYVLYLILSYKRGKVGLFSPRTVLPLAVLGVFTLGFVFPYITAFRQISNEEDIKWSDVNISIVFDRYLENVKGNDTDVKSGTEYFMSRASSITSNAYIIDQAQKYGTNPTLFYYSLSALIPRIIWPDKPPIRTGAVADYIARGYSFEGALREAMIKTSSSSLSIGFIGAAYWYFGIVGAILLSLFAGFFFSWTWYQIKDRMFYDPIAIWIFYIILEVVMTDFEGFLDCGVATYAWITIYIIIMKKINFKPKGIIQTRL